MNSILTPNRDCQLPAAAIGISRTITVRMMATIASNRASNLSLLSISCLTLTANTNQKRVARIHEM